MLNGSTIVFDLDGTLADTLPDIARAANAVLRAAGHEPLDGDAVKNFVGEGSRVLLARSFAARGAALDPDALDAAYEEFLSFHGAHLVEGTSLYPNVVAALDALQAQGARLAVCTNKPSGLAVGVLEALGVRERFAAVVGGDTFPVRKPDPAALLGCVDQAGGDPARALMVGDSHTDVETARRANIPVAVVTFGYTSLPADELGADRVFSDFADLPQIAAELLRPALT